MSASSPLPSATPAAAEQRVRGLLAQEKWRQARDELKPLVKADRARFLPLLVEANVGLARKMLASGQVSDARQVLSYLATIAPPSQLRALELEVTMQAGATDQTLPRLVAALAGGEATLAAAERVRLADAIVLAFAPVPVRQPPAAAEARLAAEVGAVHEALRAVAEQRWGAVAELLRPVAHRSAFAHWVAFVKGIAAWHAGEAERAERFLGGLPEDSVPGRAGQAYLALWGGAEPAAQTTLPPAVWARACRLLGAAGAAESLPRAEQLWREGQHAESYRVVREAVPAFPAQELDWVGVLTDFYFKAPFQMGGDDWLPYLRSFLDRVQARRVKNDVEAMRTHQMLALMGHDVASVDELREGWEEYLQHRGQRQGNSPAFLSLAYAWLGGVLAAVRGRGGYYGGRPQMCDPQGAIEMLSRSIELDPTNLAAHLKLCEVYGTLKRSSERNRLLDQMTARFPDERKVLVQAAQGCLERKALGKGLAYLARARQLDQLDPQAAELMVVGLQQQAWRQFQQGRADKARATLAQGESCLTDKADDLVRSRWTALVRHAVMEQLRGELGLAQGLLQQAGACAPSRAAYALCAHLAHRRYTRAWRAESPFVEELRQLLREAPRIGELDLLLRQLAPGPARPEDLRVYDEEEMLARAMQVAVKQPFTRAEAVRLIETAGDNPNYARAVVKLVERYLRTDPRDPRFRLWQGGFGIRGRAAAPHERKKLQQILDEALRRHDEPAIRQARQLLRDLDHPPPPPLPFPPEFFAEPDDDGGPDDEFEPDDDELPPGFAEEFAEVIELLRRTPDRDLRRLRKSIKREMPDFLFDLLVEAAKSGEPLPPRPRPSLPPPPSRLPPAPPAPRPAPPHPAPPSDPNQLDLF